MISTKSAAFINVVPAGSGTGTGGKKNLSLAEAQPEFFPMSQIT
jgi:hypothetical protein